MNETFNRLPKRSMEIAALTNEVADLKDLFLRRLLDDKVKSTLIDDLQEQLRATNALLQYRDLEQLFKEVILAIDRLESEPVSEQLVASVADELLETFRRRKLVDVHTQGAFDARVHQIVDTVPASETQPENTIVAVHRKGYLLGEKLLRPAFVTITVGGHDKSA